MKNDKILFLVLIILFLGFTPLYSQNYSINISGGIGYPEFNHIGVGVNYKNSQIQTTIGRTSEPNYDYTSVTLQYLRHFRGTPKHGTVRPWYLKFGTVYYHNEYTYTEGFERYLGGFARIGREFNFSEKLGISFDIGVSYIDYTLPADSWNLRLFYRFNNKSKPSK